MSLTVAPGLELPDDVATRRQAILATSGAGKSNAAVVMAEQMFAAGIPWVAIDPKGDWHGVRSDASGDGLGMPVPILGGEHGDVPLDPTNGPAIARLIAERRLTCVLDVSEFDTRQNQWRFLHEFADTLLKANRAPLHLFLEEADEYLPQSKTEKGWLPKCVGSWGRLVRRGRNHGIGCTLITQRSAVVAKDVLYLAEVLYAMRIAAKKDRDTVRDWAVDHDAASEMVDSLPGLADGEAWVISPGWLKRTDRVQFPRRSTFDSGATPVFGEDTPRATLADVDIDALNAELAATIEKAAADDPERLRAEIRRLKLELRKAEAASPEPEVQIETVIEQVRVPFLDPDLVERLEAALEPADQLLEALSSVQAELVTAAKDGAREAARVPPSVPNRRPARPTAPTPPLISGGSNTARIPAPNGYRAGARRLLEAVASWPEGCTKAQAATIAGLKRTSGTFQTYLGELRRDGMIEADGQTLRITAAGQDAAGVEAVPQDPQAVLDYWRVRFRAGARRMLEAVERHPRGLTRDELAIEAGLSGETGTFTTYLGELRRANLVETDSGIVRLAGWLAA